LCLKIKDGSAKKKQHILFMIPTEGGFPTTEGGIGLINSEIRKKILQKTNMLIISHNKHARKCQGLYVLIISQLNESRTNNQLNHHLTHIHQAKHSYHVWMKSRRHNGMRKCKSNQTLCGWNKMPDHLS
jgi:hypothetical protein